MLRLFAATAGLVGAVLVANLAGCTSQWSAVLGFWFEPVSYRSAKLGGPLLGRDQETIHQVARAELAQAFAGLRVTVTDRQDAPYRVRVVQQLRDVAGASRAISRSGGEGAVNFTMLAAYAESFAPAGADRPTIVAAIGRGVGRAAVHEFTHQLLGSASFDSTKDRNTYEYGFAARREQYYGDMHWGDALPVLRRRFGLERTTGAP